MKVTTIRQLQLNHSFETKSEITIKIDENSAKKIATILRKNGIIHGLIYMRKNEVHASTLLESWLKDHSIYKSFFSSNGDIIKELLTKDSITLGLIANDCLQYIEELIYSIIAHKNV